MKGISRLYLSLQVGERLQSKLLLKTFGKIGWAAEAGIESCFRYITILAAQEFKRLKQSVFTKKSVG